MRPGDLIFVKGTSFIDREIENISRSPYSHVAGVIEGTTLIEAQGFTKTRYQTLDFYAGKYDVFTCDEATDAERAQIVRYVTSKLGTHYAYLLVGWELVRYTTGLILPVPMTHEVICSTLWTQAYKSVGIQLSKSLVPSPEDLRESSKLRKLKAIA